MAIVDCLHPLYGAKGGNLSRFSEKSVFFRKNAAVGESAMAIVDCFHPLYGAKVANLSQFSGKTMPKVIFPKKVVFETDAAMENIALKK